MLINIPHIQQNLELRKSLILGSFKSKKKQYVANLIFNEINQILLLKRSSLDSFHPSTYCLPSGSIEPNESIIDAFIRETNEECNLIYKEDYTTFNLSKISENDCDIYYGISQLTSDAFIVIDESEHQNYIWCDIDDLEQYDLILDLLSHIKMLLQHHVIRFSK